MQARLPEDKLIRTRTLLSTWSSKRACVLCDLQSLIGSLQFACKVISPGHPFMQCIINLTHNVSKPGQLIYLNRELRKDVVMWQLFLDHWNEVSLFLPPSPNNPLISIFIPMPQVLLALEPFLIISGFKVHGFQVTNLTLSQALALPGRSFTLSTLPAGPCGPIGEFVSIAITKQPSLFYPLRAPEFPAS